MSCKRMGYQSLEVPQIRLKIARSLSLSSGCLTCNPGELLNSFTTRFKRDSVVPDIPSLAWRSITAENLKAMVKIEGACLSDPRKDRLRFLKVWASLDSCIVISDGPDQQNNLHQTRGQLQFQDNTESRTSSKTKPRRMHMNQPGSIQDFGQGLKQWHCGCIIEIHLRSYQCNECDSRSPCPTLHQVQAEGSQGHAVRT